ncbi:carbohydrate porin [Rhodopila sp.]|uniref:carbohydrate porin n=1 Tax=Rhodopila sp. TaxID=2480087 RepID=UPI003D09662B
MTAATLRFAIPLLVACLYPALAQAQSGSPSPPDTSQQPASSQPGAPTPTVPPPTGPASIPASDTLTGNWSGLRTRLESAGVIFGLEEQSEVWGNLAGGLRRGAVYDGLLTPSLTLDLDQLVGWQGARFFVNAFQIHGRGPSANLVGNQQLVSNIEATRDTKLFDLWLEQTLMGGRLIIRLGQEGANDEMMITQYGAVLLNSSFGFPGLPAADLPSGGPNYPIAAPFVRISFQATTNVTVVGAVFSGDPAPPGTGDPQARDAGGTAFRFNAHSLSFVELWYSANQGDNAVGLPATYKLGTWYSSAGFADQFYDTNGLPLASPGGGGIPRGHSGDFAIYGILDQMIWRRSGTKDQGIAAFLQVMGSPGGYNVSNLFIEGGINWKAPFAGHDKDIMAFGVSYLGISPAARQFADSVISLTGSGSRYSSNETVLEASYLNQATTWLSLQPDAQYIINPGASIPTAASHTPLKNALVLGVRASILF